MAPTFLDVEVRASGGQVLPARVEMQSEISLEGLHIADGVVIAEFLNQTATQQSVEIEVMVRDDGSRVTAYENTSVFDIPPGGRGLGQLYMSIPPSAARLDVLVRPDLV